MKFDAATSKACSCKTDIAEFLTFFKKISKKFRKFLSEFLKIPNLSMQF
jgi:hypothetical protein